MVSLEKFQVSGSVIRKVINELQIRFVVTLDVLRVT